MSHERRKQCFYLFVVDVLAMMSFSDRSKKNYQHVFSQSVKFPYMNLNISSRRYRKMENCKEFYKSKCLLKNMALNYTNNLLTYKDFGLTDIKETCYAVSVDLLY